ncbi:class D beta-lactamase [Bacillus swezeyi]|uniref:class D beta-lactamase n=1 Tax=Bacillus swezeyi TaxID=1925020 RepID=UPI002E1EA137|nr:class D beta-lactamase [Bacillus swezeyi]
MRKFKMLAVWIALISVCIFAVNQLTSEAKSEKEKLDVKKLNVDEFFADHEGAFVLRDLKTEKTFVYNNERAAQRFAPQSTFKIANALIGLQVGAVEDEYDIKYWDGVKREIDVWNKDHTLGSGMRYSVVWYYQAMARDIGEQRMKEWIDQIPYGNKDISGGIDQFWLSSTLKISPLEQVDFLEKLAKESLPFDKDIMKTVKRMMIQTEGDRYTLYGKTGSGSGIGWYVGIIKIRDRTYGFATNVAGTGTDAKEITMNILKKYKLTSS